NVAVPRCFMMPPSGPLDYLAVYPGSTPLQSRKRGGVGPGKGDEDRERGRESCRTLDDSLNKNHTREINPTPRALSFLCPACPAHPPAPTAARRHRSALPIRPPPAQTMITIGPLITIGKIRSKTQPANPNDDQLPPNPPCHTPSRFCLCLNLPRAAAPRTTLNK